MNRDQIRAAVETRLLPYVERPMRYVGGELNAVRKDLADVALHGVFCFPDIYDIGMSHHGLQILYHLVNRDPRWALSRAFHPWGDAEEIMRAHDIPLWSLEYCVPVREADWLGFSVQYELQYSAVVNMLDLAGIPVRCSEREQDGWPMVVAGGPCMVNPEPLADFVDAFAVGDGELTVLSVCETLTQARTEGWDREKALAELSSQDGVYVPSRYPTVQVGGFVVPDPGERGRVRAAKVMELRAEDYPDRPLVPLIDVVHHRLAVEVMRGCSRGCRFCSAGMYYRPVRERQVSDIAHQVDRGLEATGWRDVGLLSLSTADYSAIDGLLTRLGQRSADDHVSYSLPSTRIDALGDSQIDKLYKITSVSSLTIAPEAGSQRLRDVINKGITEAQILDTVDRLLTRSIQTLKLYFMIGLPTETEDDIDAIIALTRAIAERVRASSRKRVVNVSVSPFSPKPGTPFQWEEMADVDTLRARGVRIKRELSSLRTVKVRYREPGVTRLETILARGDRRLGCVIEHAWRAGARLDGWDETLDLERWWAAADEAGVELAPYTAAIDPDAALPWRAVDTGVAAHFLRMERDMGHAGVTTEDCRTGSCSACGVCTLAPRHLVDPEPVPAPTGQAVSFGRGRAPANVGSGERSRLFWRAAYRKGAAVRFLGHRDMVNAILRALHASEVPLALSEGYHPHPKVGFGPPLPMGATGAHEFFDMVLARPWTADLARVNRFLPEGLEVFEARKLSAKPVALSADMAAARYAVGLPESLAARDAQAAVGALLARDSIVIELERKGKLQQREIRPLVLELAYLDEPGVLTALLSARQTQTLSPRELLRELFPDRTFHEFVVERTRSHRDVDGTLCEL